MLCKPGHDLMLYFGGDGVGGGVDGEAEMVGRGRVHFLQLPVSLYSVQLGLVSVEIAVDHEQGTGRGREQLGVGVYLFNEGGVLGGLGCDLLQGGGPGRVREGAFVEDVPPALAKVRDAHEGRGREHFWHVGKHQITGIRPQRKAGDATAGHISAGVTGKVGAERLYIIQAVGNHPVERQPNVQPGFWGVEGGLRVKQPLIKPLPMP